MHYVNLIKEMNDLKKMFPFFSVKTPNPHPNTCHIRIVFPHTNLLTISLLETVGVSKLLGCPAAVCCLGELEVKIPEDCLHTALLFFRSNSHLVDVWRNKLFKSLFRPDSNPPQSHAERFSSISIATWNCYGLHNSIPYTPVKHTCRRY